MISVDKSEENGKYRFGLILPFACRYFNCIYKN
jgi:hypothetical protein